MFYIYSPPLKDQMNRIEMGYSPSFTLGEFRQKSNKQVIIIKSEKLHNIDHWVDLTDNKRQKLIIN